MTRKVRIEVAPEEAGLRLDQLLAARVPELSRRKARVLLDIGGVFVDGHRIKIAGRKVYAGQVIEAALGGALDRASGEVGRAARERDDARLPDFAIVHQDDDLVVVDKPSGLLTAPTPESDRGNLAAMLERQLGKRVFVVHRLDLETSGLLCFALTLTANRALSERFRTHDLDREYEAVLAGRLEPEPIEVTEPVGGKHARTRLIVVERIGDVATRVRARLETGRTHQIRLHARHLGHPVLGDPRYGDGAEPRPPRMALHAALLALAHPRTGAALRFESPLPPELEEWLVGLRASAERSTLAP